MNMRAASIKTQPQKSTDRENTGGKGENNIWGQAGMKRDREKEVKRVRDWFLYFRSGLYI